MTSPGSSSDSEDVVARCQDMTFSSSIARFWTKRRRRDRQCQSDHLPTGSYEVDDCSSCGSTSSMNSSIPTSSLASRRHSQDEYGSYSSPSSSFSSYDENYDEDCIAKSVFDTPKVKNGRRTGETKRMGWSIWIILFVFLCLCISFHPNFSSSSSIRSKR